MDPEVWSLGLLKDCAQVTGIAVVQGPDAVRMQRIRMRSVMTDHHRWSVKRHPKSLTHVVQGAYMQANGVDGAHAPTLLGIFLRRALNATVVVHPLSASGDPHSFKHGWVKTESEIGPEGRPDEPRTGDFDGVILEEMDTELIGSFSGAIQDLQIGLQSFVAGLRRLIIIVISEHIDDRNVAEIPSEWVRTASRYYRFGEPFEPLNLSEAAK